MGVASAKHIGTQLIELLKTDKDFIAVSEEVSRQQSFPLFLHHTHVFHFTSSLLPPIRTVHVSQWISLQMQNTICLHRDDGKAGGLFKSYHIIKVHVRMCVCMPATAYALLCIIYTQLVIECYVRVD